MIETKMEYQRVEMLENVMVVMMVVVIAEQLEHELAAYLVGK
jgi:hypothetical protein